MKMKDYGGPAFPIESSLAMLHPGMTLRDYFAAAALTGFLHNAEHMRFVDVHQVAEGAYKMADAMLKAREEGGAA